MDDPKGSIRPPEPRNEIPGWLQIHSPPFGSVPALPVNTSGEPLEGGIDGSHVQGDVR